jgi:CHAT domain-containing protein
MRGGEAPRSSGELFDALFRPVSSALTNLTNLVVVTDAPYDRVAFAALWDRRRDRYFVEDHQVLVSPSATAYAHARSLDANPASAPQRRAAFITAPNVEAAITRSAPAAQALLTAYGAGRLRRYDAATASDLSREVADVDIVHVAAHVVANERFPSLSQIHLADDPGVKYSGSMLAREVGSSQPLRAQLVALEQGANNPLAPLNEGTLGLARTLLNAGVANVVSPVVSVEMATVEQTWLAFHRHYASGTAAAESLRRAQLMALNESNRRPGPWATLTVFGSTQ